MGARRGQVKSLHKLCDWAKELQLTPQELRNEVRLSKDKSVNSTWQMATLKY